MSHNDLLRIQNLKVCAGEKEILHGIDLDIHENEVHVLMGPNGTGKSTLGAALMGNPAYTVTGGEIIYKVIEDEFQGGSGAGCSAVVFNSYLYDKLKKREINRVLFAATGALLSTVSSGQGESIPCICHAVSIENV